MDKGIISEDLLPVSVLYVEDEPLTRQVVAGMIKRRIPKLFEAEDGKEGLALFRRFSPDIVISDIMMPHMDGIGMSRVIKSLDKDTKIILTTAHSDAKTLLTAIEVGVDNYILKPVDMDSLFAAIDKCAETIVLSRKIRQQDREKDELIAKLQDALENVKKLSGLIPICSKCKKIRDDKGYWNQIEIYISEHSDALFTHGLCDECTKTMYPEYYDRIQERKKR
jgi:sigma-B regulation protein RsbU (phosphoserine phosphatase)